MEQFRRLFLTALVAGVLAGLVSFAVQQVTIIPLIDQAETFEEAARTAIVEDRLTPAFKMMARVARVQQQLIQSWEALATITPADYTRMRDRLGGSSGFQSVQYQRHRSSCWSSIAGC